MREFKVRFHLGRGKNFLKWRVENIKTGKVGFFEPERYSLQLDNCKLYNQTSSANKIFNGSNKAVCAWIMVGAVNVVENTAHTTKVYKDVISYNPRKTPNWIDSNGENIDKNEFLHLKTYGKTIVRIKDTNQ